MTDKVATLSGVVQSDERAATAVGRAFTFRPIARNGRNTVCAPTRIGSANVSSSDGFKIELPAGEYFILAVPAAQNRLWQDPKRLAAASALATRVTLDVGPEANGNIDDEGGQMNRGPCPLRCAAHSPARSAVIAIVALAGVAAAQQAPRAPGQRAIGSRIAGIVVSAKMAISRSVARW